MQQERTKETLHETIKIYYIQALEKMSLRLDIMKKIKKFIFDVMNVNAKYMFLKGNIKKPHK